MLLGGDGLVGRSIAANLKDGYQIIPTAGHHDPESGYQLTVEEPDRLVEILAREDPEIVVSSVLGDYEAQMSFHKALAERLAEKRSVYCTYPPPMCLTAAYPSPGPKTIRRFPPLILAVSSGIVRP